MTHKTLQELVDEQIAGVNALIDSFPSRVGKTPRGVLEKHLRQSYLFIAKETDEVLRVEKKENFVDAWCAGYDAAISAQKEKRDKFFGEV